jgi:UrcA family protein
MKTALIGFAALGLASTAATSNPILVTWQPVPTAHVSFADLNLGSPDGRAVFEQRIHAAADTLCFADRNGDRTLEAALGGHDCYKAAVADGLRQMGTIVVQQTARASGR